MTLKIKHFGDKIRTCHLNSDRFPNLPENDDTVKFPKFGILTRYEDGTVGVSIHYMKKEEKDWFGAWVQEATSETTLASWSTIHDENPSFLSVEDAML